MHVCRHIPYFGASLQAPFKEYLVKQKRKLHHKRGAALPAVCCRMAHQLLLYFRPSYTIT